MASLGTSISNKTALSQTLKWYHNIPLHAAPVVRYMDSDDIILQFDDKFFYPILLHIDVCYIIDRMAVDVPEKNSIPMAR